MKKWICMAVILCMCAGIVSGCGTSPIEGDTSAVYVDKKGRISSLDVEELGGSFYDEQELKTFIDDAVAEYTKEHGRNAVTVEALTVEDGVAKLTLSYQSAEDYTNFLGVELFSGELLAALEAGYVFEGDFARVEEGQVVGAATKQEIYAEEGLKVVIIRANTDVEIEGSICYVSCENVRLDGANRVSIRDEYRLDNGAAQTEDIPAVVVVEDTEEADGTETVGEEAAETEDKEPDGMEDAGTDADLGLWDLSNTYTFIVYR